MNRRTAFFLLTAAVAALLWLLVDVRGPGRSYDGAEPQVESEAAPDLLSTAPGEGPEVPDDAPTLAGAGEADGGPERGPVRVRVLGTSGQSFPRAYVAVADAEGKPDRSTGGVTDASGERVFDDLAYDGSVVLMFFRRDPQDARGNTRWDALPRQGAGPAQVSVTGPEVVYRARTGLPLEVRVVSAETGTDLDGVKVHCGKAQRAEPRDRTWQSAPQTYFMAPNVGRTWVIGFTVAPLDGWVEWDRAWVAGTVSPYARSLAFVYPLRREVPVTVTAVGLEGEPLAAALQDLRVAERQPPRYSAVVDAYRRLRVLGVPHLWGEPVRLEVTREDGRGRQVLHAMVPDHPGERIELAVVLGTEPPRETVMDHSEIGIGGGSSSFSFRSRTRYENRLEILVLRHDGSPAVDAEVAIPRRKARTDVAGRVRFENVTPGAVDVQVRQPGLLPLGGAVEVPKEGTLRLTLTEGDGADLEVLVVGEDGRPLPFAALAVKTPSALPWVDLQGTHQRIDPYTDHLGRRLVTHVESGALTVTATWGSRKASQVVEAVAGETVTVRLVLPRPRPR